jgi:hypothetical protein
MARRPRLSWLLLPAIVAVGLVLRILGVRYGFPLLVHSDERAVVQPASHMLLAHTLNPESWARPNHFSIYLSAALYYPLSHLVLHQPFSQAFNANPAFFYEISRLVVVVLGTISIVVGYFVGREFNRRTGYLVAGAFAVFPPLVEHAHYATPDVPLTLLLLLVVLFTLRFLRNRSPVYLGLSIVAAALATIEKYPGVLAMLLILASVIVVYRKHLRSLVLWLAGSVLSFCVAVFVFSPFLVLHYSRVLMDLSIQSEPTHLGADGLGWLGNLGFYAHNYYVYSGLLLLLALALGLAALLKRKDIRLIALLFSFGYWLALSKLSLHWDRWALPMYIGPLILACIGIDTAFLYARSRQRLARASWAVGCLAVVVVFGSLFLSSLSRSVALRLPETRVVAGSYLLENGIDKQHAIYDGYTPFSPNNPVSALSMKERADNDQGVRYVVISSEMYDRYLAEPERYAAETDFYRRIMSLQPLQVIAPAGVTADIQQGSADRRGESWIVPEMANWWNSVRFLNYRVGAPSGSALTGPTIEVFLYPRPWQ